MDTTAKFGGTCGFAGTAFTSSRGPGVVGVVDRVTWLTALEVGRADERTEGPPSAARRARSASPAPPLIEAAAIHLGAAVSDACTLPPRKTFLPPRSHDAEGSAQELLDRGSPGRSLTGGRLAALGGWPTLGGQRPGGVRGPGQAVVGPVGVPRAGSQEAQLARAMLGSSDR